MRVPLIWNFSDDFTPPKHFDIENPSKECMMCPFFYGFEGFDGYDEDDEDDEDFITDDTVYDPHDWLIYRTYDCRCKIANKGLAKDTGLCPLYDLFNN